MNITRSATRQAPPLRLKSRGGYVLRALVEGSNVYPQVTAPDGTIQYPAWNPIKRVFQMWDREPEEETVRTLSSAWASLMNHPSMSFTNI